MSKIKQSGGFFGRLFGLLMEVGLPLMKNVLTLLAKSALTPLGITTAEWAINAGIYKKIWGSKTTTLIISNEEMRDIMKIVTSFGNSGLYIKSVTQTIENDTKE